MQIRFHCPTEKCVAIIELEPLETCDGSIECPRCHTVHVAHVTDAMKQQDTADRCAICNSSELFVRKDFPQALGLAIVVLFGVAAIYYFRTSVLTSWAILLSAMILDLAIYSTVGRVTTCYACRAEYRKCNLNPNHEGFDLATSEKY